MASSPSSHMASLSRRLDALAETYKQTLQAIHRIPRTPDAEDIADLSSTVRDSLNSLAEDLDLLNLSIEDIGNGARPDSDESKQKLRLSVQSQRLGEDIRNARQTFRRTQIHVKQAEETARRRERDERLRRLRAPPSRVETPAMDDNDNNTHGTGNQNSTTVATSSQTLPPPPPPRRKREDKLTEDDLLVNASGDVLAALRQTHALMATEVSRSHFAAEILANSTRELEHLNESYTDLDAMLKTSKGLVTQLMKSNKSDTWYLMSARMVLLAVAAWLVWRRLLWGPTWWVVWLPLKFAFMMMGMILRPLGVGRGSGSVEVADGGRGVVGGSSAVEMVVPSASVSPRVGDGPGVQMGQKDGGDDDPSAEGSLSQKIGRMVEGAGKIVRGDGAELEDSTAPRNPKKRVLDTSKDGLSAGDVIDEVEAGEQWQDAQEYVGGEGEAGQVRDEL